ncbi:EKC/KEOPS complex subunit bud32 isoform X2 [Nilaparvata lugens]|uniref:EKC/KEOPS complex subunit bud32 isoform X2 n=1 Tax=Nilaparvata lugens TaxID=108931 RepID=UPI00193CA1A1|nr:EKC/KEOPS complex subunit bud32 isoform X2 [Nilaparvata lugens]
MHSKSVRTPALYLVDLERRRIFMEHIDNSVTAKQYINSFLESESENDKLDNILGEIGTSIAKMHNNNIIHGDLTTSNILVQTDKVYFIDFGLSSVSGSIEDKAVDLYVLERALISTHAHSDRLLKIILDSYFSKKLNKNSKEIMHKLEDVRSRGRKRTMVG